MTCCAQFTDGAAPLRPGLLEVEASGEGHLIGSLCPKCGAKYFPQRGVCSRCLGELEPTPLATKGRLYTYTVLHQAAPGFEVPFVLGYVDLEDGVRVMGQLGGMAPEDVKIGMELELAIEPFGQDAEGEDILGYRFHQVGGAA